jgi:hypothetical protein
LITGFLILLECIILRKYISISRSNPEKDKYFFLPLTTLINVGLVILGMFFKMYNDSLYALVILVGMSIGLVGDINNVSINQSTQCFIQGSVIFIMSYITYSLALIHTTGGFILPIDVVIVSLAILIYIYSLKSTGKTDFFQSLGKFKVVALFYPIMLLFLLSRALLNFFQSSLPLVSIALLTCGILLILITDIEFSMDKFFKPIEKRIGPLLYPLGQLVIALSTIIIPL